MAEQKVGIFNQRPETKEEVVIGGSYWILKNTLNFKRLMHVDKLQCFPDRYHSVCMLLLQQRVTLFGPLVRKLSRPVRLQMYGQAMY